MDFEFYPSGAPSTVPRAKGSAITAATTLGDQDYRLRHHSHHKLIENANTATMTAEDVEMSLDDDIIPLDEEEQKALAEAAAAGIASSATAPTAATEETAGIPEAYLMDLDDYGKITPEKIHVRGVDEMSTEQVTAWANGHTPGMELRRVEWIDDTSCERTRFTTSLTFDAKVLIGVIRQPSIRLEGNGWSGSGFAECWGG